MIVGIDARAAVEAPAGSGRVVRELLRALDELGGPHEYRCYARSEWCDGQLSDRVRWRLIGSRDGVWHARAAAAASRECNVFLATTSYLTVPLLRIPAVPIVLDLLVFDPAMQTNARSTFTERRTLGLAVRRAAGIVTISQYTAGELRRRFPRASRKITVAPLAPSPLAVGEPTVTVKPGFVLAVGTLEPRKNLPRLVEAYTQLPPTLRAEHRLVVAGKLGWEAGPTVDALRSLGDQCEVLGYVSDGDLAELYSRCAVFCFPSLGEGFGLPPLEAMSRGAAVITSDNTSLPEVCGDAAVYVDPLDPGSISAGLEQVLSDRGRRDRLAAAGLIQAARFSWRRTAEQVLQALTRAAGPA